MKTKKNKPTSDSAVGVGCEVRRFYHRENNFKDGTKYLEWRKGKGMFAICKDKTIVKLPHWKLKAAMKMVKENLWIIKNA